MKNIISQIMISDASGKGALIGDQAPDPYYEVNTDDSSPEITSITPQRVSDTSEQPLSAFVEIFIQGQRLTFIPPTHVVSLEFTRLEDAGSTFILTIFDKDWDVVEYLLANNHRSVQLRYGDANGLKSRMYSADISVAEYQISFNNSGTVLTIKGVSQGTIDNLELITLDTETTNPTEAVKKICKEMGWRVLEENFEASEDVVFDNKDSIALIKDYPVTYIRTHLEPIAVRTSDGESGYHFYLDTKTNPPTAYFKCDTPTEGTKKTYIYMKGVDSPIIDLTLSVNGVFGGGALNSLATELEASFIDPSTKEEVTLTENIDSVRVTAVGEYSHTDSSQAKAIINAAGSSKSQMNAILKSKLKSAMPYSGTLTILGDPTHEIGDYIRLIIITNDGNLHHSSGLYLVKGIVDNIDNGIMTTTLSIFKGEDIESGIEISNYRTLVK